MRLPRDSEITLARRLILVIGLAYLAAQLLAFSLDRPPSWDEAIYLSQVTPGAEPLPFVPSRARGITFLAIPVLQLGGSLSQLRLFLAVASTAALVGAFRMWVPVAGYGATAAALLFAGAWPVLFYGSELMPNLWMALTGVAATAVLARRFAGHEGRHDELIAGGLVAVAALIRPLDAVVLTAALVLLPVAVRRATVSWTVHLALGLLAGWAPWLVEMTARFGSPWEALAAAARTGHAGRLSLHRERASVPRAQRRAVDRSGRTSRRPLLRAPMVHRVRDPRGPRGSSLEPARAPALRRGRDGHGRRPRDGVRRADRRAGTQVPAARAGAPHDPRRLRPGHHRRRRSGTSWIGARAVRRAGSGVDPRHRLGGRSGRDRGEGRSRCGGPTRIRATSRTGSPQAGVRRTVSALQRGKLPHRRVHGRLPRGPAREGPRGMVASVGCASNATAFECSWCSIGRRRSPRPKAPTSWRRSLRRVSSRGSSTATPDPHLSSRALLAILVVRGGAVR